MAIIQRCAKCQWRFPLDVDVCPNPKCSSTVSRGLRNLYFRMKIKGKRHEKAAGRISLQEARIKYAEWVVELGAPAIRLDDLNEISLKDLSDAYIEKLRAEGKSYHVQAKIFLTRMQNAWGEDVPALNITPEMIELFKVCLREKKASPAYVDRHLQMGRAAWNHSLRDSPNPFNRVKLYHPDNTLIRELTPKEEADLLLAAKHVDPHSPPHFYEMIMVALHTGLRASNVFRLRAEEVDFETSTIRLIQKRQLRLEVYMSSLVKETLRKVTPNEAGWFFPNPQTGQPYRDVGKTFAAVKKKAQITKPFRFHDLRHHFAKRMAEVTGGNVLLIKTAMGHRDIKTSLKYTPPFQQEVRDALEKFTGGSSKGSSDKKKVVSS